MIAIPSDASDVSKALRCTGGLLWLVLAGCRGDDDPPNLVRKTIGPAGGLVTSHDGVLTIVLQAGALPEATDIEVFPSDDPPLVFGPAYRVRPNVALEIESEVTYRRVLPNDPSSATVGAIHRADFEGGNGFWRALPRLDLDVEHDAVLASDGELSLYYALLDVAVEPGTDEGSSSDDGSESTTETAGEESDDTDATTGFGPLSHAADIAPIWAENCLGIGCHEPQDPPSVTALFLDDDAYAHLVGVSAIGANLPLVDPGDPEDSYILYKLRGEQMDVNGSGSPMPLGKPMLPAHTIAMIEAWIEQGAPE